MKRAIITGVTGQDGSYLAELLLNKNYSVLGIARTSQFIENIKKITVNNNFKLVYGDIIDYTFISNLISTFKPDEIYNLAGVTDIQSCWDSPHYTIELNSSTPIKIMSRLLESNCRVLQASSREIFGNSTEVITESSVYSTENPYGTSKLHTHLMVSHYRKNYGSHFNSAILFNHESVRRSIKFITKKVTSFVRNLYLGNIDKNSKLSLGNINVTRDWGYAPDYVYAMWLMLQQDKPDDYIICTSKNKSIEYLLDFSFSYKKMLWQDHVEIDNFLIRKTDIQGPRGSYDKINRSIGWKPQTTFEEMIIKMIENMD